MYPCLLRNLVAARPNHVWAIDITYIRLVAGWMYRVAVLDLYARYVVSWELDQRLELRDSGHHGPDQPAPDADDHSFETLCP